ncbi:hypothetical protein E1287_15580 [Actinomadura sp. KC06]|uniref:hypothetical protein n=1 Tax=Actinomadura sp. KC06 TaxID=2530369 RepID=UPI0010464B52|nr:hypothetical protein [Actinomadura sp. KC06]TDD34755.1 hypothetical protein E1287_15580 [Actinomadura sp. KC06]
MGLSYPMKPSGSDRPEAMRGGLPGPQTASVPLHQAGEMPFGGKPREECWRAIGPQSRARINELTGDTIEWYACEDPSSPQGRPYAVVVGDEGLAVAEPRIDTDHRPVYAISAFLFASGTLRHVPIDHRPPPHAGPAGSGIAAPAPPDIGLSAEAKGLLGNLPPRAQELLQAPFTAQRRPLRHDWWYHGSEHRLDTFVVFLAGERDVTFATGTKDVPVGHDDASAHWSLTCYQATVERRIGR